MEFLNIAARNFAASESRLTVHIDGEEGGFFFSSSAITNLQRAASDAGVNDWLTESILAKGRAMEEICGSGGSTYCMLLSLLLHDFVGVGDSKASMAKSVPVKESIEVAMGVVCDVCDTLGVSGLFLAQDVIDKGGWKDIAMNLQHHLDSDSVCIVPDLELSLPMHLAFTTMRSLGLFEKNCCEKSIERVMDRINIIEVHGEGSEKSSTFLNQLLVPISNFLSVSTLTRLVESLKQNRRIVPHIALVIDLTITAASDIKPYLDHLVATGVNILFVQELISSPHKEGFLGECMKRSIFVFECLRKSFCEKLCFALGIDTAPGVLEITTQNISASPYVTIDLFRRGINTEWEADDEKPFYDDELNATFFTSSVNTTIQNFYFRFSFSEKINNPKFATILVCGRCQGSVTTLRGSVTKSISILRNVIIQKKLVPGGGFLETLISLALEESAKILDHRIACCYRSSDIEDDGEFEEIIATGCVVLRRIGEIFQDMATMIFSKESMLSSDGGEFSGFILQQQLAKRLKSLLEQYARVHNVDSWWCDSDCIRFVLSEHISRTREGMMSSPTLMLDDWLSKRCAYERAFEVILSTCLE